MTLVKAKSLKKWSILEIKVQQEMPLWLTSILSKGKIYKTTFSKVGEAFKKVMNINNMIIERKKEHELTV